MALLFKGPFTVADYHRMAECGILAEDAPVELLEGQVVVMSPIGVRHAACVDALNRALVPPLVGIATVRVQGPIVLDDGAEPEPDISVFRPGTNPPYPGHPRPNAVLLVIEVGDTSLRFDRDIKLPLYARAGIPEVWLVDLTTDTIHVHRDPSGDTFRTVRVARRGDEVRAQELAQIVLSVDNIIPANEA